MSRRYSKIVALNFDVLAAIMGRISNRMDLLAFMKTCKTLYREGIPYFLGLPVVIVYDEYDEGPPTPKHRLFCQYMLFNESRFIHIKDFTFHSSDESRDIPPLLRRLFQLIFQRSTKLERFCFYCLESFGMYPPALPTHSSFENLQRLNIMSLGPDGAAMIRGMHAPLKMLTLSFDPDADIDKNPLVYLENFSSTLESFEISFGRFLDEPTSLRCDSLRRMRVFDCDIPDSSVIVQVFPKLSEFSFFDGSMDPEPNRGIRNENVERLDELERKWQALGSVHGEINSLYEFGLSCEVRRMDLHSCAVGRINSCRELLVKTRPSKLAIGMDNPQAIFAAERDIFGYGGLTELHVSLVFTREFVPSGSPHELFENLINSVKHATSLSHVRITISSGMQMCHICQHKNLGVHTCAQAEESNELMASSYHYPPSPVGEWLLKLDTQDFVQRLIKAVSTLESFVLDMGMGIPPSIHGWKISRDASPQLVEVLTKKQCMELVEKVRECDCHYYY